MIYSRCMQGNTVGSLSELLNDSESAYILGLWCADGYYWSSSIGITNVDWKLVKRFSDFLEKFFPKERIKLRVYHPLGKESGVVASVKYPMRLAKQVAYQLYVNSRPLLRLFQHAESKVATLPTKNIMAYFAGRFDGDGSIDKNLRNDLRIVYSNLAEAKRDENLLAKIGNFKTKVYKYRKARTYVLYISRHCARSFFDGISPHSLKAKSLLPRRDLFRVAEQMSLSSRRHNTPVPA